MKLLYIVLLPLFFFFIFVSQTRAADVLVEGKLVDQNSNPIPQGSIVFTDTSGKTVTAAVTDFSGKYKTSIATGTYTVVVNGPQGSRIETKTLPGHRIDQSVTLDFTLDVPKIAETKKPSFAEQIVPYGGVLVLLIVVGLGYMLWKKNASAKPGSSD